MIVWVSEVPNIGLLVTEVDVFYTLYRSDYQNFPWLLCRLLHRLLKCQCGQQFYSELHLLDILMTGFMGSPSYNIKNFNILLFTHEFNRKHYQTLKAKRSGTISCLFLKRHRKWKLIRVRAETISKYWIIKGKDVKSLF